MKNRPDKPGFYFWEDIHGLKHIVEVNEHLDFFRYDYSHSDVYIGLKEFERRLYLKRWIGPAIPPKKVTRYDRKYMGGAMFPVKDGEWVRYEDIREFLTNEE